MHSHAVSESLSKIYSLNYDMESYLSKIYFFISLYSSTIFLYLVSSLESNSHSPALANEKSENRISIFKYPIEETVEG